MRNMVSPRNYTLRTTKGHTIAFKANEPTPVPYNCQADALAVNILFADGKHQETSTASDGRPAQVEIAGELREVILMKAIDEMMSANTHEEWTAGGRPKVAALSERTGLKVDSAETNAVFEKYRDLKAAQMDLPQHARADYVIEVQALNTPKQIKEYAEILEIPAAEIAGLSVHDAKQVLLAYVVNE